MPEPVPLFQSLRNLPREQIVEMMRDGRIKPPDMGGLRKGGRSRQQARDDIKKYEASGGGKVRARPNKQPPQEAAPPPETKQRVEAGPPQEAIKPKPAIDHAQVAEWLFRGLLIVMSISLTIVGEWLNWGFNFSFGEDTYSSVALGVVGVIAGLGACFLLAVASILKAKGKATASYVAGGAWFLCLAMDILASTGFASRHIGNHIKRLEKTIQGERDLELRLATAKSELYALATVIDPRKRQTQIQEARNRVPRDNLVSSNDCTNVTKSWGPCTELYGLHEAERADGKAAEARQRAQDKVDGLQARFDAMNVEATQDSSAAFISQVSRGAIPPSVVGLVRVGLIASLICAGPGVLMYLAWAR